MKRASDVPPPVVRAGRWPVSASTASDKRSVNQSGVDRKASPARGDYVYFVPPDNPYYRDTAFVKIVAGAGGDIVRREGRNFYVNDRFIGAAKAVSRTGNPLTPGPVGLIPQGQYFVFTPHRDSYDSRYEDIGWIGRASVIGVAKPIL